MGALKENTRREAEEIRQLLRQQMDVLAKSCETATASGVAEVTKAMLSVANYMDYGGLSSFEFKKAEPVETTRSYQYKALENKVCWFGALSVANTILIILFATIFR